MKIYHLTLLSVQLGDIKYIHNPPSSFKNYLFIYLLTAPGGMWDLSSVTRDETSPCSGSVKF